MELKVNGAHVDITLEGESTIGEVLRAFEEEASKNDATTISIMLNGKEIPAESFDEVIKEPIKEDTLIELSVICKTDVIDLLKNNAKELKDVSEKLMQIPVLLQSGKDKEAFDTIGLFAQYIDAFCHAATLSSLFPEVYTAIKIDGKETSAFFEEFAPVLKDFEEAFAAKDTVTIGDLAEYEISPRIESISQAISTTF